MSPLALLLGDPERLPFPGHLRLSRVEGDVGIAVSARVGVAGLDEPGLVLAWRAARALEQRLDQDLAAAPLDRHALLHALWQAVAAAPASALGPAEGSDLSLLAVAFDAQGLGIAGVGLASVWGRGAAGLAPLVATGHPLLAPPGRPERTPGVLTLDRDSVTAVIGVPSHLGPTLPPPAELDRRCGVRP